ncbi:cation diffusion facilitator family transporter [Dechloromonas sp. ZY10]|uniref:cation diffusion facilitator family transporter n=1 Tax=Dechloromonas aquae TaxID=2664436 RepID=UPI0035270B77
MAEGEFDLGSNGALRHAEAQRATWLSAGVNLLLTLAQLLVGWLAHSQSLLAHGLHSFSDLLSDFLVLFATRQSAHPADAAHPYGHARFETAATLILGTSLALIGGGILWDCASRLQQGEAPPAVAAAAFWVALATVVAKEGLYRYLAAVADRLRSKLLLANALHTRADAASALVVVVGVGGALLGWPLLDLLAAALMGLMILRLGGELGLGALRELIDTGLEAAEVAALTTTVRAVSGVVGEPRLRTRRMAQHVLVDAHVQVRPRISVSEGHRVAEAVRERLLAMHRDVLDVLVHIDPEDDGQALPAPGLPTRDAIMAVLAPGLAGWPPLERMELHYLGGRLEIELFFTAALPAGAGLEALEARIAAAWPEVGGLRNLAVWVRHAP